MAIDYSKLNWNDLVAQAQRDRQLQWNSADSFDPYHDGRTNIGGLTGPSAQIYLPQSEIDGNPWDYAKFNFGDTSYVAPDGSTDWMTQLSKGDNGAVNVGHYKADPSWMTGAKGILTDFVLPAVGMYAGVGALGGAAGGAAGAAEGAGGLSSGGGAVGSSAAGGGDLAGGFSFPTAEQLSSAGFDSAGMGMTGAGGIGSVGSVAGAGGGATNYGAGMGMFDGIFDSIPQGAKDFAGSKAGSTIIGGLLSGLNGSKQSGTQTITNQQSIDPRMAAILYGNGANPGVLGSITGLLNRPQNPGMAAFGNTADQYLANNGGQDLNNMRNTSNELMRSLWLAPQMQSAQIGDTGNMSAAQINAPGQNDINLSPAYANMIYGNPAENPYLTGAIQKGINQSSNAFGNMLTDATRNLTQGILPSIRSGARVSGSYGGDREGIATGQALNDFSTQMGRALSQVGQNNTDAAVGAQAGAFDNGQNRALSALSGLNGNQYNVAGQNAGFQQQANEANYQGGLQKSMQQAQLNQNAALANQSAQLGTNQLNTQRQLGGLNAGSGILGQAYGFGTNQDAYAGNKVGQVSGLLSPFTGLGGSSTQSQPLYQNTAANVLGGGLLGASIYNMMNKG